MSVAKHQVRPGDNDTSRAYDVSVKAGNIVYVVLYVQPPGTISPEYRTGLSVLVLVGHDTIKFNDQLGRSHELPILARKTISDTTKE